MADVCGLNFPYYNYLEALDINDKVKLDFESLTKEVEAQFRRRKVRKKDVKEAIKWARKK